MGKYSQKFQKYLLSGTDAHTSENRGRVDHATAGAQHATKSIPGMGIFLAFAIAGHHTGLPDWNGTGEAVLKARMVKHVEEWQEHAPMELLHAKGLPPRIPLPKDAFSCAFFLRMLFSCLTDADFLATESFMNQDKSASRAKEIPTMAQLANHLSAHLQERFPVALSDVNRHRQEVLLSCSQASGQQPGFFSLNVPTGGGKTLSSLSFALQHAAHYGLRRVICAIPFTNIIEQNAKIYREIFTPMGEGIVLEHHASLDCEDPQVLHERLAVENWDAPIIVTTNVQFFETLFAHRPGRCRKLHRIARSVIILDEAQALPVKLLEPCLKALKELVKRYQCSVVLCTATQPALEKREKFEIGLEGVRAIIPNASHLHKVLKRVKVANAGKITLEETVSRLAEHQRVLAIVNTRRHAQDLYTQLKNVVHPEECHHLSALMCPAHRLAVLKRIRDRLKNSIEPCRVVATQLVEAGVDVDFPVVFRSLAGLDAIAQAAGRCNREGLLPEMGLTCIFTPSEQHYIAKGIIGQASDQTREIMESPRFQNDFLALEAIEAYFRLHYWQEGGENGRGWDQNEIMDCFKLGNAREPFLFNFRTAADTFQLIENHQKTVIIPWDDRASGMIDRLRTMSHPELGFLSHASQVLQRYIVNIKSWEYKNLVKSMAVETLHQRFQVLLRPEMNYSQETGLLVHRDGYCSPENLIV